MKRTALTSSKGPFTSPGARSTTAQGGVIAAAGSTLILQAIVAAEALDQNCWHHVTTPTRLALDHCVVVSRCWSQHPAGWHG